MAKRSHRRGVAAVSVGVSAALVLAACGADEIEDGDGEAAGGGEVDCTAYEQYGDLSGTTVNLYTSIVAPEDQAYIDSFDPFEECTGAEIVYEGSREFEAQLVVRIEGGNAPDIAWFPQPGLLDTVVRDTGAVVPAPPEVEANVDEYFNEDWKQYGTVDDVFYAAPNSSNVKSFVWYSPSAFADAGYEVPTTYDDLIALSDQIVADGSTPWCVGIGSGDATGWPLTDWMEDFMLREHGPEVYDQWVANEVPFNDPQVASVLERVGGIVKNPDYVNGGLGDVQSIASTTFSDAGLPILDGECWMHRQASFYAANWPEGTEVAEDGDVYAFYLPTITEDFGQPVLVGGEFTAAFADRPEVVAFQTYLASPEYANNRAPGGTFVSANTELDTSLLTSPIDVLSAEILTDPDATIRFDGSDLMPGEVGAGSFWTEMTAWVANDKPDGEVLDALQASWPSS